jgi:hypothetical protein
VALTSTTVATPPATKGSALKVPKLSLAPNTPTSRSGRLSPRSSGIKSPRKARCNFADLNELGMSFDNEEQVEEILSRVFSSSARNSW